MTYQYSEMPTGAERDFLNAFGATAIYIAAPPLMVRIAHDPARSIDALRRHNSDLRPTFITWVHSAKIARRLIKRAGEPSQAAIIRAAADLNISLSRHDLVMSRARDAVRKLDALLMVAQANGKLRFFNRAYRAHRLTNGAIPYGFVFRNLRRVLVLSLAQSDGIPWSDARLLDRCLGFSDGESAAE